MELRMSGIVNDSIVDGPGMRLAVFVQGCPHRCPGCHNPDTHSFSGGYLTDTAEIAKAAKGNPLLRGVTFSGGEPFCQSEALAVLGAELKETGLDILTYTGYCFEELLLDIVPGAKELLAQTDILIDGRYEEAKRDLTLKFRGSTNQRILDCQASLSAGRAIEIDI